MLVHLLCRHNPPPEVVIEKYYPETVLSYSCWWILKYYWWSWKSNSCGEDYLFFFFFSPYFPSCDISLSLLCHLMRIHTALVNWVKPFIFNLICREVIRIGICRTLSASFQARPMESHHLYTSFPSLNYIDQSLAICLYIT